jgi:hypothetical protein
MRRVDIYGIKTCLLGSPGRFCKLINGLANVIFGHLHRHVGPRHDRNSRWPQRRYPGYGFLGSPPTMLYLNRSYGFRLFYRLRQAGKAGDHVISGYADLPCIAFRICRDIGPLHNNHSNAARRFAPIKFYKAVCYSAIRFGIAHSGRARNHTIF